MHISEYEKTAPVLITPESGVQAKCYYFDGSHNINKMWLK